MSRIFLVHGWGGGARHDWFPWAKRKLQKRGHEVIIPEMPDPDYPKIESWVTKLKEVVGKPLRSDVFIGHSVGCSTIFRYLETLKVDQKVDKVVLIAPWQYLTGLKKKDLEVAKPWVSTPLDFEKVRLKAKKFIAVFSDNDHFVPIKENLRFFKENLNPEIIVKSQMAHFNEEHGIREIPFILDLI